MKPSIPKGTRDFLPQEVLKRKYIFDTIESVFKLYGYLPIETPAMESLSTLTGKYGEEGDRLLFKILNNGDFLSKADSGALDSRDSNQLISSISKRGLRYDLTVPFARYVVMHQNDLQFPFKRYHIQPVWRADRPQKGRYQEFYQCDADIVGSTSLMNEAELVSILDDVFSKLKMEVTIKVNNRKILYGVAEAAGIADRFVDMTTAIDKLDKIGLDGVSKEMENRGIDTKAISMITDLLQTRTLKDLDGPFASSETGRLGLEELRAFHGYLDTQDQQNDVVFDVSLARGLSYYTGCIFEVMAKDVKMGSISGGGRYDNLTEVFGMKDMSGVGISFGAERIYDVMEELGLFDETVVVSTELIFLSMDEEGHRYAYEQAAAFREADICVEVYPDPVKIKKQFKFVNARKIPFAAIIGSDEVASKSIMLKNMETGDQESLSIVEAINRIKERKAQ